MTNDTPPSAPESEPPIDESAAPAATTTEEGGCGLEVVGVALIGFGVLISLAIPVVIIVGWIPVAIGALILRHAKRRAAKDGDRG